MLTITLSLPEQDNSYSIFVGEDIFENVWDEINKKFFSRRIILFCDNIVRKLYAKNFLDSGNAKSRIDIISFAAGEKSKSIQMKEKLETILLKKGFDRNSILIALGGGVTGDLGGFISATYYRGIPFIQIPTTLLAMVDSSIGGKVGVNHYLGKNLIGAFYQPKSVYIDPNTLKTLPKLHFLNGLAEVIKTALINDESLFIYIEKNYDKILNRDYKALQKIIHSCCLIKSRIVMEDEKEANIRKILNYGHTIGHAIEKLSNYKILHGFAISIGMNFENRIALCLGILKENDVRRIENILIRLGLPTRLNKKISIENIVKQLKYDKKTIDNTLNFSLLNKIGKCNYNVIVEKKVILESIKN